MSQAARKNAAANLHTESAPAPAAVSRGRKSPVFLVTQDESLWRQIGHELERDWALKQIDSIDELQRTARAGQSGIILWDARDQEDRAGDLSRLQLHSARFAIIVLDNSASTEPWRHAIQQRQILALLRVPFEAAQLGEALASAREECHARSAVLGDAGAALAAARAPTGRKFLRFAPLIIAAVCVACGVAYLRHRNAAKHASPAPAVVATPHAPAAAAPIETNAAADEQVDTLLQKAQQAMLARHFIEPADGNALTLYQNVLMYDPSNGEAQQGLQRLAQILFARVQSDLDERKFDAALQALETARSISPHDPRLADLDARIATLRAELGPAQIEAAISAKNFDRAFQLLDDAARAKSLGPAKLNQLRDEARRRQEASDVAHLLRLLDTRMQQDRLIEPRDDSAVYYLQQASQAGASPAELQEQAQALSKKLMQAARVALDQHRLADVDRLIAAARDTGGSPKVIAGLQRDLDAARDSQARDKLMRSHLLDLAQARLAQGEILEPDNDNALFYVDQLRAADPTNAGLALISGALQDAITARARAALDSGDAAKAEALVKAASGLGSSAELDALSDTVAQQKLKQSGTVPSMVSASSLVTVKPLKLEYPRSALAKGTEGWVDVAFNVTTAGKVINVTVLNASPPNVFESAAKSALARVRYRPVLVDGQAREVKSRLHLVFRLESH